MLGYVVRRILATIPVMGVVALFVFSLLYIAPGDPAAVIAGDQATPADVERIRQSLGLDRPFLVRFGEWFFHIIQGDMGTSIFTNLPVWTMIRQRIEPTLSLMIVTLIVAGSVGAWWRNRGPDASQFANLREPRLTRMTDQRVLVRGPRDDFRGRSQSVPHNHSPSRGQGIGHDPMTLPLVGDEFFDVLAAYNLCLWPFVLMRHTGGRNSSAAARSPSRSSLAGYRQ